MFSTLRTRFGIPGVISVMALVFAMFGGAYAASNSSDAGKATASAKAKKGPRGPKGATGPAGPAGPQGPKGDNGAAGSNGAAGANGESVKLSSANSAECPEGGVKLTVGTSSSKVCNGAEGEPGAQGATGPSGSPWVVGQAPSGVILKGTWSMPQYTATGAGENIRVAASSGVPVPGSVNFIALARGAGLDNGDEEGVAEIVCPGTAENPTINSDFLKTANVGGACFYAQAQTNMAPPPSGQVQLLQSGGGAVAAFKSAAAGTATGYGTWVMLTPPA